MYWESLNLSGKPASAAVEDAARWVQWAQAGITDEQKTRYNLDQFWKAKAAAYSNESAEGRAQLEKLDVIAHSVWSALEGKTAIQTPPGFLSNLASVLIGTTPARPEADLAIKRAKLAVQSGAAASRRIGGWGSGIVSSSEKGIESSAALSSSVWKSNAEFLGVPIWAWIAGGGMLGLALLVRK